MSTPHTVASDPKKRRQTPSEPPSATPISRKRSGRIPLGVGIRSVGSEQTVGDIGVVTPFVVQAAGVVVERLMDRSLAQRPIVGCHTPAVEGPVGARTARRVPRANRS